MNTVGYLLSLQTKHTFYANGLSDLETLLDGFDYLETSVIEQEFTNKLGFTKEQFMAQLNVDLKSVSENEMIKLADIMENINHIRNNKLVDCIRKAIYYYGVRNPEFEVQKYFRSFALGAIEEMKNDLYSEVVTSFEKDCDDEYTEPKDSHYLRIFQKNFKKQKENGIFEILRTLYHEEFHMLVDEMQINPACFKLDILDYQRLETFRTITLDKNFDKQNYVYFHEEAEAEIFGTQRAITKIKELNPSFSFSKIQNLKDSSLLWATESQFENTFKTSFFKRVEQKKFIEAELDTLLPMNPEQIYGILSKVYDETGHRKTFKTLVSDFQKVQVEHSEMQREEIENFYTTILYEAYLNCEKEEKEELRGEDLLPYVVYCLQGKIKQIEKEIENLKAKRVVSVVGTLKRRVEPFKDGLMIDAACSSMKPLKRKYKKHFLLKELKELKNELEVLNKEESIAYGL